LMPMLLRHRALILVLTLVALQAPRSLAQQSPAELVLQLGADEFDKRERAQKQLIKLGPSALAVVRKGLAELKGLEIQRRLQRVYWGILVTRQMARAVGLSRDKALVTLTIGKRGRRVAMLGKLLRANRPGVYHLVVELLHGPEHELALRFVPYWLNRRTPGPQQKALMKVLLPLLEAKQERVNVRYLDRALEFFPARGRKLLLAWVASSKRRREERYWAVRMLIRRRDAHSIALIQTLAEKPGSHHIALARNIELILRAWPRHREALLPALRKELLGRARLPKQAETFDGQLRALRGRWPGWNADLMQLIGSPERSLALKQRLILALRVQDPLPESLKLLPFLSLKRPKVSRSILDHFRRRPDKRALPALRKFYAQRPDWQTALALANLLATNGSEEDWKALERAATDPATKQWKGRYAAFGKLAQRPGGKSIGLLVALYLARPDALGQSSRDSLASALTRAKGKARLPVSRLPVALLQQIARSAMSQYVRRDATHELTRRSGPAASRALLALLGQSEQAQVLTLAADRLQRLGEGEPGKLLTRRLSRLDPAKDAQVEFSCTLITVLRRLRHRPARAQVRRFLKARSLRLRTVALSFLGQMGEKLEQLALVAMLQQAKTREERSRLIALLGRHVTELRTALALLDLLEHWQQDQYRLKQLISATLGSRTVVEVARRRLEGKLAGGSDWLWSMMWRGMWRYQVKALRALLRPYLAQPKQAELAVQLLAAMGEPEQIKQVLSWIGDAKRRALAYPVLRVNPDERALFPLIELLDQRKQLSELVKCLELVYWGGGSQRWIDVSRAKALWRTRVGRLKRGSKRVDWLRLELRQKSRSLKRAVEAARRLGDPRLLPELTALLERRRDTELRSAVVRALGATRDPSVLETLEALQDDYGLREPVLLARARLGDPGALRVLARSVAVGKKQTPGWRNASQLVARAELLAQRGMLIGWQALIEWGGISSGLALPGEPRAALSRLTGLELKSGFDDKHLAHLARYKQLIGAWWADNRDRVVRAQTPGGSTWEKSVKVMAELPRSTGLRRNELIARLSRAGKLHRPTVQRYLLGADRALRDDMAEILYRRNARWAAPLLLAGLRDGHALPARRVWAEESVRLDNPPANDRQALDWLRGFRDPLTEALLATAGPRAIGPLVAWSFRRSRIYRLYLLLRLRQGPTRALAVELVVAPGEVRRRLAAWSAWHQLMRQPLEAHETKRVTPDARMLIDRVDYALQVGESERAWRWARRLQAAGKLTAESRLRVAQAAEAVSRWRDAVTSWDRFRKARPGRQGQLGYARSLLGLGQYGKAEAALTLALALPAAGSSEPLILRLRGRCREKLGQLSLAEADYLAWEKTGREAASARYRRVRVAWRRQQLQQVLALTQPYLGKGLIVENGSVRHMGLHRVYALVRLRKLDRAQTLLASLERLAALLGRFDALSTSGLKARLALARALYHGARDQPQRARSQLQRAIRGGALTAAEAARFPELSRGKQK